MVQRAITVLVQKGFDRESDLLRKFTVFRSSDNWLNSSIEKENAYAATNYPFEIMTLYPDFFQFPLDDVSVRLSCFTNRNIFRALAKKKRTSLSGKIVSSLVGLHPRTAGQ